MSDSKVMSVTQAPSSAQAEPEEEVIDTTVRNNYHVDESEESITDNKRNKHLVACETHQNNLNMDCPMIESQTSAESAQVVVNAGEPPIKPTVPNNSMTRDDFESTCPDFLD